MRKVRGGICTDRGTGGRLREGRAGIDDQVTEWQGEGCHGCSGDHEPFGSVLGLSDSLAKAALVEAGIANLTGSMGATERLPQYVFDANGKRS
jgi:hypothetical protein